MAEADATDVRTCIDLYATIWSSYRTRPFTVETVARTLIERGEYEYVSDEDEPEASLDRLVEWGLLKRQSGEYRVTVPPDGVAEELTDESVRTEVLRHLVTSSVSDEGPDSDGGRTLSRDGETYAVAELDPGVSVEEGVELVRDADGGDSRGVVVTTPGTNADTAQKIADRLVEDTGGWEKAGSNVVKGNVEDDELVFRLYLDAPREE